MTVTCVSPYIVLAVCDQIYYTYNMKYTQYMGVYALRSLLFPVSQMDEDQFVAIQTVAGFNQIKKLTTDKKLIVEAIKSIECV